MHSKTEKSMVEYLVIGAGVVGGMVARELCRYTPSVHIVERAGDVAMGATRANSAIVHAGFDCKVGTLKAKLNVKGSERMAEVCRDLGVKYVNNGSLVVGFNEEDEATLRELLERGVQNGVCRLQKDGERACRKLNENKDGEISRHLLQRRGRIW